MLMTDDPISEGHYFAFGLIVQQFAQFERIVEFVINSAIRGKVLGLTSLVLSGLSYSKKCDLLKALLQIVILPANGNTAISRFIETFNTHKALRNFIAHSAWTPGARPDAIRPLSISANWGKLKVFGLEDSEREYTTLELLEIAAELRDIRFAFHSFILASSIAENTEIGSPDPNKSPSPPKKNP
jgi:hypothetical protein